METKNKTIKTIAPVFVILAAVFWGVLVIFIRALGQAGFGSMEIVSLRMYSSVIFAWAFVLLFENRKKKKDLRPFHLKDSWCFIGTGLVSIVFFSYCFFCCFFFCAFFFFFILFIIYFFSHLNSSYKGFIYFVSL